MSNHDNTCRLPTLRARGPLKEETEKGNFSPQSFTPSHWNPEGNFPYFWFVSRLSLGHNVHSYLMVTEKPHWTEEAVENHNMQWGHTWVRLSLKRLRGLQLRGVYSWSSSHRLQHSNQPGNLLDVISHREQRNSVCDKLPFLYTKGEPISSLNHHPVGNSAHISGFG